MLLIELFLLCWPAFVFPAELFPKKKVPVKFESNFWPFANSSIGKILFYDNFLAHFQIKLFTGTFFLYFSFFSRGVNSFYWGNIWLFKGSLNFSRAEFAPWSFFGQAFFFMGRNSATETWLPVPFLCIIERNIVKIMLRGTKE